MIKINPFFNINALAKSRRDGYLELSSSYYLIGLMLVPIFYTYIIFPFYRNEYLYQVFAYENTIFNLIVIFTFIVFSRFRVGLNFKKISFFGKDSLYSIILIYTIVCLAYILGNLGSLGFGFYSGCHYCGPTPFLGWGVLKVLLFDLGVILIMLAPIVYHFYRKRVFLFVAYSVTCLAIFFFFLSGSYRNQVLPIIFSFFVILIYNVKNKKIAFSAMLCISPIAAIAYAFNHYFSGQETSLTLYEYFSMNEFFSNYNNFIIYSNGFILDLPFPGASYLGPLLHRLSSVMDTGFVSSAGQMARFMNTGIGYGFSPLLEAHLNFGSFYFFGAVIIGILHSFIANIIYFTKNKLICCVVFGLAVFFIFNINRVDFTAAFNIVFHKMIFLIPIYFFVDFERDIYN